MRVISIDPEAAGRAVDELNGIGNDLDRRAHLPGPPPLMLLPHQTAAVLVEVLAHGRAIHASADAARTVRAGLARTTVKMMLATGDYDNPAMSKMLEASFDPIGDLGTAFKRMVAPGEAVLGWAKQANELVTGTTSVLFVGLYAHARHAGWLAYEFERRLGMKAADAARAAKSGPRALGLFGEVFDDALKRVGQRIPSDTRLLRGAGRAWKALPWIGNGLSWHDAYSKSDGNWFVRGLKATTVTVLTANPAGAAIDFLSGGVATGSVNAIAGLGSVLTGDTAATDAFTKKAQDGTYGPVFQFTAALGDGFAGAATGDLDSWDARVRNGDFGPAVKGLQTGVNAVIDKAFSIGNPFK